MSETYINDKNEIKHTEENKRREWQLFFERAKRIENRQAMKDAARNCKALEGVVKTLRWTLGEQGIESPLQ